MATQVFLHGTNDPVATTHRGTNTARLNGSTSGWRPFGTGTARGTTLSQVSTATVTGPTAGIEGFHSAGFPAEWITPPVDADVTISGTITANIWAAETNMSANVAINFYVDKIAATDGTLTRIVTSARTTEVAVTTAAVNNFTATPTSTALNKGDRLRIVIFGDDAGTMNSGFTFLANFAGTTAAADGDTFITFNETFGFQTTDPAPTSLVSQLTADATGIAIGDATARTARAQSFQLGSTATVNAVSVQLSKTGSPTDNVTLSLEADAAGVPSGTPLSSGTYAAASLTAGFVVYTIPMTPVSLTGSTTYWLVIRRSGAVNASNYINTDQKAGTNPYANGAHFLNDGSNWAEQTNSDLYFNIRGDGATYVFLTDTASAVATANTDYEAWTTRGDTANGVVETRNPGAGWIAPVQIDDGAAVAIDWFTRPLQAFTLSGLVKANLWAAVSAATANQSIGCQVARVEGDGTGATVWGYANRDAATTSGGAGEVGTSQAAYTVYISGDDLSISAGQRLRIRVFVDDCADIPTVSGTFNFRFDGDTGGAQGDTFLTFEQTLLESTPGTAFPFPRVDRSAPLRDTDPWSLTGWRS